jgi:hypothetical protein
MHSQRAFIPILMLLLCFVFCHNTYAKTLSIKGEKFYLDDVPLKMLGLRAASATQSDEITDHLLAQLDDYASVGLNTINVYIQGSSGGFCDPFNADGTTLKDEHKARLIKIIKECDKRSMVVVVGIFYQRVFLSEHLGIRNLLDRQAIFNAVKTVTTLLKPYDNVIINIANEQNSFRYKEFQEFDFRNPENIIALCKKVKDVDSDRLVGGGGYDDENNVIIGSSGSVDVLLFDTFPGDVEKGRGSGWHYDYFQKNGVIDKPIVNVETFGAWTKMAMPPGVFNDRLKAIHLQEIDDTRDRPGLYVHLHSNPWCQGPSIGNYPIHYELGGDGSKENPGIRWWFEYAQSPEKTAVLTLDATRDFELELPEKAPFYVDRRKWSGYVAINPMQYRDQWGGARTVFQGAEGKYNIELVSSPEIDGQSSYAFFVNDEKQGEFTHNLITRREQEKAVSHIWKDIKLAPGDILQVHAKSHSNKLIPEEGAPGGFAWSRARWSCLKFYPKAYDQLPDFSKVNNSKIEYTPVTLAPGSVQEIGFGNRPDIAVDNLGNLHLVYARDQVLYYKKWDAASKLWSGEEKTSVVMGKNKSYVTRADPDILIGSNNEIYVMSWSEFAVKKGNEWNHISPTWDSNYRDTEMAIDNEDNIYLIKRGGSTGGNLGIQKLEKGASEWVILSDPDSDLDLAGISDHVYPDICIDHHNNIHIVRRHGPGNTTLYHFSKDGGKSWTHSVVCEDEPEGSFIETLSEGTVIVTEGHGNVYRLENGNWNHEGQQIPCEARDYPELCVDNQDNVYSIANRFKFNIRKNGKWGEPRQLFGLTNTRIGYVETAGGDDFAYVVWEEGDECFIDKSSTIKPPPVKLFIGKMSVDGRMSDLTD